MFNKEDDDFLIDGSSYKGQASKNSIVGTWWNHEIVNAKEQISAVSGRIIPQNVTFIGKEKLKLIKLLTHYILILSLQMKLYLIVKN